MILVRSPLRITLGGGGTDIPAYADAHTGFCLTACIDKYVYVAAMRPFEPGIYLKYSEMERCARAEEVRHPIIREVLTTFNVEPQIEITTLADVPAGTGLGSSSSFTTALIRTLMRDIMTPGDLAECACEIEIDRLGAPVGKQDQYAAAHGGLLALTFEHSFAQSRVLVAPLVVPDVDTFEDGLVLYFTGYARDANAILRAQSNAQLDEIKDIGMRSRDALVAGKFDEFGRLLDAHWQVKRTRSAGTSNAQVDDWYRLARESGAIGGKLVGAGGGGCLLFYSEEPRWLRRSLRDSGLQEIRFRFDWDGTKVLTV